MITTRGWAALGASAALIVLWVGFGEPELLAGGIFLVGSVIVGALIVRRSRPDADLTRHVTPFRLHEGDRARVEIRVHARRALRPLIIEDEVSKLGRARFATSRAGRNSTVSAHYEIVCRPEGRLSNRPRRAGHLRSARSGGGPGHRRRHRSSRRVPGH